MTTSGAAKCWGQNDSGQLGDGTTVNRLTPVDVDGLGSGVQTIAVGGYNSCAVVAGGAVKCWGAATLGLLIDGHSHFGGEVHTSGRHAPAGRRDVLGCQSAGPTGRRRLRQRRDRGYNELGSLGDGTTENRAAPVYVAGLTGGNQGLAALAGGIQAVTGGDAHGCALNQDGAVKCWGANASGQLGDGTTTDRLVPVDAVGLASGIQGIVAGIAHTCALTGADGVTCWGANGYGQLGDGTTTDRPIAIDVSGLGSGILQVAAGGDHSCATTQAGAAVCWGRNAKGQLGDGTTNERHTPVPVSDLASGVLAITAGGRHACVVAGASGAKCWGDNVSGQLGDGTGGARPSPVVTLGFDDGCADIARPKVLVKKLNTPAGDDGVTIGGQMVLPFPFAPALDPVANGLRIALYRAFPGGSVIDETTIPGGAWNRATKKGWKANAKGTAFSYGNAANDLPSKIVKVKLNVLAKTPGLVKFSVKGKDGSYALSASELPLLLLVGLESPFALHGQCGIAEFAVTPATEPICALNGSGSAVVCK